MSNNTYKYDIHERIFIYIVDVINFVSKLPKTPTNLVFINQIIRSVTSMGANDQEADGTSTKKDFLHCFTTVRKESKETVYWLRIINKTNPNNKEPEQLITEGKEIVAVVSRIIISTSNSLTHKRLDI